MTATVPLPRSRPIEANLESQNSSGELHDGSLLDKLASLLPPKITLASLEPGGGVIGGPNLASLGFDNLTAVYDISARVVYMPNGSKMEAHSGYGNMMDNPEHISERNLGPTPPNVYDLVPREQPFHGVKALRMIPSDKSAMFGRSGLLTHSYLLGPNGDSNGCVSFKNYDAFLQAFKRGEVKRLVVVASLDEEIARRS